MFTLVIHGEDGGSNIGEKIRNYSKQTKYIFCAMTDTLETGINNQRKQLIVFKTFFC